MVLTRGRLGSVWGEDRMTKTGEILGRFLSLIASPNVLEILLAPIIRFITIIQISPILVSRVKTRSAGGS